MAERTDNAQASSSPNPLRVRFDRFELDEANARLLCDGTAVPLAPRPFAVLCTLVRNAGSLLTANALLDQIWGHQFVTDSVLRTAISELRTALNDDARKPRFIETVSRRGYRFIAAPSVVAAAPGVLPKVLQRAAVPVPCFIGRAEPLSRLRRAWDTACSARRAIVWVVGEPGIGKTTLIEQFVANLGDVACARGQCVEHHGTGESYLPVLEALEDLCRSDSDVPTLLRAVAPTWLLQLPWLSTAEERDALRRELAGVSPDRMLREMGQFLDRYTERRPLLLITEDLHWSDRATVQLVDYIARRRGGARLMWLASFRLAEVVALDHPLNPLRHELRLHELCEEIVLDPFSESEVADYVMERSPVIAADEAFVRTLHERTDGLPLFVASVMTDVITRSAQAGSDAATGPPLSTAIAVPENQAAIIDHYIAKLTGDQRLVLTAAAICGVEFRISTVSAALERDAVWVSQACEELAREQLWLVAPRAERWRDAADLPYSFRHALVRQVLYERTNPSVRSQLHRAVGTTLERERAAGAPAAAADIAMHLELGREPMAALRFYVEAADAALAHLGTRECLSATEHALTLLGQAPQCAERDAIEISLATLQGISATHVLGMGPEATRAFRRAYSRLDAVPDHSMRGRLLHGFGLVLSLRAEYAEALAVAERAEALSSAGKDPVLALVTCIVHGEVDQRQGRSSAAGTWIERGLAAAALVDLPPVEVFVVDPQVTLLGLYGIHLLHAGLVEQGRARMRRADARARQLGWPNTRLSALWFDALFEVRLGNTARVASLADEMDALVEESAVAEGRIACRWLRGWADARMGRPREGYRAIREAYEDNTRLGMLAGASEVLGYSTEALVLAGDWDAAQRELDDALRVASELGERVYMPQLLVAQAAIARACGDRAAADAAIRRATAEAREQEARWLELLAMIDLCGHHGATVEDRRALGALVDALPEASDTTAVATARTLLERPESA